MDWFNIPPHLFVRLYFLGVWWGVYDIFTGDAFWHSRAKIIETHSTSATTYSPQRIWDIALPRELLILQLNGIEYSHCIAPHS